MADDERVEALAGKAIPLPKRKPATAYSEGAVLEAIKNDIFAQMGFDMSKLMPTPHPFMRQIGARGVYDPETDMFSVDHPADLTALTHEMRHRGWRRFKEQKATLEDTRDEYKYWTDIPKTRQSREETLMRMADHMYAQDDPHTKATLHAAGVPVGSARKQDDDLVVKVYQALKFFEGIARGTDE